MKTVNRIFVPAILVVHILFTLFLFYQMFIDYSGWTLYHVRPVFMLGYTLLWLLIQFRFRWAVWVYLLFTLFDAACKYVYSQTAWGEALEETLFPLSMIFLAVLMLMYKTHFDAEPEIK